MNWILNAMLLYQVYNDIFGIHFAQRLGEAMAMHIHLSV